MVTKFGNQILATKFGFVPDCSNMISAGLAGFFHLVEETGLNPGLNRPGRNRFLPPEVEETGRNWKIGWNAWLSKYFPLQEAVILKTKKNNSKMCWI